MIAFALGIPGTRNGHAYMHSHMLAVRPDYRNAGLGRRVKLFQREDALGKEHRPDRVDIRSAGDQERLSEHREAGRNHAALHDQSVWQRNIGVAGRFADRSPDG